VDTLVNSDGIDNSGAENGTSAAVRIADVSRSWEGKGSSGSLSSP